MLSQTPEQKTTLQIRGCKLKRYLFFILLAAAGLFAGQSAPAAPATGTLLEKIEQTCAHVRSVTADFAQTKTIQASGKVIKSAGKLHFESPERLAMVYSTPATHRLTIDGARFYMARGGAPKCFDTDKNAMMRSLRNTLLYCVRGKARSVAQENGADISATEEGGNYVVTLTARKPAPRGYSSIILTYRKADAMLVRMEMNEFSGIRQVYAMSAMKKDVPVPAEVFAIPENPGR